MNIVRWALCVRHLVTRIGEQLPEAFKSYSLMDILGLYKHDAMMPQRMVNLFGIRGAVAAMALKNFASGKYDSRQDTDTSGDMEKAKWLLYPIWTIMGWTEEEMVYVLDVGNRIPDPLYIAAE